ncbi:MAG: Na/Pi cotransporter family protein, partial [Muriicola sp.]|nr:Na/Pi cotransporter family protein [Muriicola sp.]
PGREIDEPKYLDKKMLQFPETAIASLVSESKYLFQNAIFEIVTHAFNIHREDLISEAKAKEVVRKSDQDLHTNVRALYLKKVKTIYGSILQFATNAQSNLKLSKAQNNRVMEIKLANRKMVEILRSAREVNRNIRMYTSGNNEYMRKEYDYYRKLMIQVLRGIFLSIPPKNVASYEKKLMTLRFNSLNKLSKHNDKIDKLIRDNRIDTDMASSLVNDYDNLHDLLENIITVSELLYCRSDTLFSSTNQEHIPIEKIEHT